MRIAFHKMHGLGNDFVVIDLRAQALEVTPALAAAIADRRRGVGCDQLILLAPSASADLAMRIFNADGSEAGACGNASRAIGLLLGGAATVETAGGTIHVAPDAGGVSVTMADPRFDWASIPLAYAVPTDPVPVGWDGLDGGWAINVGNPHIVFFVDDVEAMPLDRIGPLIEQDPLFPERVNVNIAARTRDHAFTARVWERGAGLTQACGTGACATAVAAIRRFGLSAPVTVTQPGGTLTVAWQPGAPLVMTGPATHVFDGVLDLTAL